MTYTEALTEGLSSLSLTLDDKRRERFETFLRLLTEKNKVMDLTAITNEVEIASKHMVDSCALLSILDFSGKSVIDVGCGAGFPGLPMLIYDDSIKLTLMDSLNKRLLFIEEVLDALSLRARVIHARAEEAALKKDMRESFDFAVSRAVAPMNILCELCLPLVKVGGRFAAMKSTSCDDELSEASRAIKLLGGEISEVKDYEVRPAGIVHRAVIIKKTAKTPKTYPRRFSKIKASPL